MASMSQLEEYERGASNRLINDRLLVDGVEHFLTADPYYACLLIVHPFFGQLHAATQLLQTSYNWPSVDIGRNLTDALLTVPPRRRSAQAGLILEQEIKGASQGPVICTEIDLLFIPELDLDPLDLLRQISHRATIIVAWPGSYEHDVLAYAQPKHSHYRTWRQTELSDHCVLSLP